MEQWLSYLNSYIDTMESKSLELIYHPFQELVYYDIYYMFGDHELAEDVVQESFLKVITKAPKLENITNIKAWIKKVARNTAYDITKRNKKYLNIGDLDMVINTEITRPVYVLSLEEIVEEKIRDEILYEAMHQLRPNHRRVLFLYYMEGKSYREIAIEMGIPHKVIAQLLVRARKKLLHYFSKKWDVNHDGR